MKNDPPTTTTYTFLIIYIVLLIYIIIGRVYLNVVKGLISEHTPIEIVTPIVLIITIIFSALIFSKIKDDIVKLDRIILIFGIIFLSIFFARELNIRYFHWSPLDVIGFVFLIIFAHRLWQVNKYTGYFFIFGILAILIAQVTDNLLDAEILSDPGIIRNIGIVEESSELYASIFFLNSISYLWIMINEGKNPFKKHPPENVFLISWLYNKK